MKETMKRLLAGISVFVVCALGSLGISAAEWKPENSSIVTVPASVTSIDPKDLAGQKAIQSIQVETGNPAFCSRNGILYDKSGTKLLAYPAGRSEHAVPEGTTTIGSNAFFGQEISEIAFPNSLTELENFAFDDAIFPKDTVLRLPSSLQKIGTCALCFAKPIKCVIVPPSVRTIGYGATYADIVIVQGRDTEPLSTEPFLKTEGHVLIGGWKGTTLEKCATWYNSEKYDFAELSGDGRIVLDPSWISVSGFFAYNGKPIEPMYGIMPTSPLQFALYVKLQLSCSNNVNAGWATVVISADDEIFCGSIERQYLIPPAYITSVVSSVIPEQTYTGEPICPRIEIPGVTEGKDYTVKYSNNVNIGTATVTIYGKGNYTGKTSTYFSIVAPPSTAGDQNVGGTGTADWSFTVEQGTGWQGQWLPETAGLQIDPGTVSVSKLKAGKQKITVQWKKKDGADGYQIQYSTNKRFTKGVKTKKISRSKVTSCVLKGLRSKKKYYVRIRTYKKVSGTLRYGAWSGTRKVKVR